MTYVEGFVVPVPVANKDAYARHARDAFPLFREFGVSRMVEAWGDDVPRGKLNDLWGAVKAEEGEAVVFSWFEYPDKATRDAANARMMEDPRMAGMGASMPFDGKRMIIGGFASLLDEGGGAPMGCCDGMLVPVPEANRDAYRAMAEKAASIFREHGASRVVEAWGDDVFDGKVTDFRKAVLAEEGEQVVFSWIEWPSPEARAAGWEKVMADARMKHGDDMPFDGKRMIWGSFTPIVDA